MEICLRFCQAHELVVGSGYKGALWPEHPRSPDDSALDSGAEGKTVRETEPDTGITISRFGTV